MERGTSNLSVTVRAAIIGAVGGLALGTGCSPPTIDNSNEQPVSILSAVASSPPVVVSLTFDDGLADQIQGAELLSARGMHGTFYVISGRVDLEGSLSTNQMLELQAAGHEIGAHTVSHVDLLTIDEAARLRQLCQSRFDLMGAGLEVTSFAYPFGSPNGASSELPDIEEMLRYCGYNSARGSGGLHTEASCAGCPMAESIPPPDPYHLKSISSIKPTVALDTLEGYVTQAEQAGGGWVALVLHHVCDGCADNGISPALLGDFLDWLAQEVASGAVVVKTAGEVVGGETKAPVPAPPRPTPAPGSNLAPNPSLEIDRNGDQVPDCWQRGGSGTSTVVYSLTSAAHSGNVAQQIDVSDFVSGGRRIVIKEDAFDCAPTAYAGHVYQVSAWYTATAPSRFSALILDASDKWTYFAQGPLLSPVDDYAQASWTIPALPMGVKAITVGLTLGANGRLRMDDFDLQDKGDIVAPTLSFLRPINTAVAAGTISVAVAASDGGVGTVELLVDGSPIGVMTAGADGTFNLDWRSTLHADGPATLQARTYDLAGNLATTAILITVANTAGANLMPNPSLEVDSNQDTIPDCWSRGGSGTSSATYSMTSVAHSGSVAQQIDVANFASGARRIVVKQDNGVCSPRAIPGHTYQVSAWYTSTASARFTAYVLDAGGTWTYFSQGPLLSPVASYTQAGWTIPILPAGTQAISVGLSIVANGQLRMDDFELRDLASVAPTLPFATGVP